MRTHCLKTWPEPWLAVATGNKTFEFRRDDRGFMVGDVLELEFWDPSPVPGTHSARGYAYDKPPRRRSVSCRVTYMIHGGRFGIPAGYVVMSIEPLGGDSPE